MGGVVVILLAGYIAGGNWRNVFLIYLFSAIVFVVIAAGLPEPERKAEITVKYRVLPRKIYFLGIGALLQRGIVVFLASDASSFITGVNIPVDGGYTAK